jgi:hypothetical protein
MAAAGASLAQLDLTDDLGLSRWRLWGGRTTAELIAAYGEPGPSMPVQLCNGAGLYRNRAVALALDGLSLLR